MITTSEYFIKQIYYWLHRNYSPIAPNCYLFEWESDLIAISNSQLVTEFEIKISKSDFKADFRKTNKHKSLETNFKSKVKPGKCSNYFYYVTTPGLLNQVDIPDYAGLIEIDKKINIVKKAPILHKETVDKIKVNSLYEKVYYKYWQKVINGS